MGNKFKKHLYIANEDPLIFIKKEKKVYGCLVPLIVTPPPPLPKKAKKE